MPPEGGNYEQQDAVLDLLRRARERIANGWVQHDAEKDGAFCIVGAVHHEIYSESRHRSNGWKMFAEMTSELLRGLPHARLGRGTALQEYNDAPGRTQAEIVALFDAAIARREETR